MEQFFLSELLWFIGYVIHFLRKNKKNKKKKEKRNQRTPWLRTSSFARLNELWTVPVPRANNRPFLIFFCDFLGGFLLFFSRELSTKEDIMEITLRLWHWPKQRPEPIYTLISTFIKFPFFPSLPLWPQAWKLVLLSSLARSQGRSRGWKFSSVKQLCSMKLLSTSLNPTQALSMCLISRWLRVDCSVWASLETIHHLLLPWLLPLCHLPYPCHTLNIIPR